VLLFVLALTAIVLVLYALVLLGTAGQDSAGPGWSWWDPGLFALVSLATLTLVGLGSLYKVLQLSRGGGPVLAASLGGRPVARDSDDLLERRLLNVVDEMAIAAGVPVPRVFVLREEAGINAFAAGYGPGDAVVAVTRGALEQLTRDELQGVVAHEFSHVFHGDMRLNLRLLGLLHGILLIALLGRVLLRGSSRGRSRSGGGLVVAGLGLMTIGYVGVFFGRLIKAAVSRQREFLADAAAVQYTRNPPGIAGALKKLAGLAGGGLVRHPAAESASHMFFDSGVRFFTRLLATHPPLEERIRRLDRSFAPEAGGTGPGPAPGAAGLVAGITPAGVRARVGRVEPAGLDWARALLADLPGTLREAARTPAGGRALLQGLLVAGETDPAAVLERVLPAQPAAERDAVLTLLPALARAGLAARLPLAELAIGGVTGLPAAERERLSGEVDALVQADRRLSLFEFCVQALLDQALERRPAAGRRPPGAERIRADTGLLLSLLAHAGQADPERARQAFDRATAAAPLDGPWELAPRRQTSLEGLGVALDRLATVSFRFRGGLIEACVAAIVWDGQVTLAEAQLLQAIGARLGCPVPPLVPGTVPVA
jgi:Zn-dependent protease with chaperone function